MGNQHHADDRRDAGIVIIFMVVTRCDQYSPIRLAIQDAPDPARAVAGTTPGHLLPGDTSCRNALVDRLGLTSPARDHLLYIRRRRPPCRVVSTRSMRPDRWVGTIGAISSPGPSADSAALGEGRSP
jgi:hypothetical protein